jgi:hypothetical protein
MATKNPQLFVRLTKLEGGSAVRTDTVIGITHDMPTIGNRFEMVSKSLDPTLLFRKVTTSRVVEVMTDGSFRTETGSVYHVHRIREEEMEA